VRAVAEQRLVRGGKVDADVEKEGHGVEEPERGGRVQVKSGEGSMGAGTKGGRAAGPDLEEQTAVVGEAWRGHVDLARTADACVNAQAHRGKAGRTARGEEAGAERRGGEGGRERSGHRGTTTHIPAYSPLQC